MSRTSIDSIVRAREVREEQLLGELARLQRALVDSERRLERGLQALQRADERGPASAPWLSIARDYRRRLEREVFDAEQDLARCRDATERARRAAVGAAQDRRSAEQVAERRAAVAAERERQIEGARMDEIGQRLRMRAGPP